MCHKSNGTDCATFLPFSGFMSLLFYILFSYDKTVPTMQKYYFSFISYHFLIEKFNQLPNFFLNVLQIQLSLALKVLILNTLSFCACFII